MQSSCSTECHECKSEHLTEDFPLSSNFRFLHFSFEPQHPSCQSCHSDQRNYARSKSGLCLKIVKDDPQAHLIWLAFWFAPNQWIVTPWTVAYQVPLFVRFPRQEYWSVLPFPSSGESSQPRNWILISCIGRRFLTAEPSGKPRSVIRRQMMDGHLRISPVLRELNFGGKIPFATWEERNNKPINLDW